jgi:hypothetical protein
MDVIQTLGALSGVAFLSGLRLYSTVLVAGLGIRFGFLHLPESLEHLRVLATTPILALSGVLYAIEFVADKIPWVDSAWDAVHTVIRPLGAAVLGATAFGAVDPSVRVGAALLCGGIALSSHAAKSGTRLVANHSPEPVSNVALSLGEDVSVVGGVWLALTHPIAMLVVVIVLLAIIAWLLPKIVRLFGRNVGRIRRVFGGGGVERRSAD